MSGIHEQCQEDFLKKQIEAWIQTDFGPRCDTFEETCIVCRKWKALDEMFDGLTTPAECVNDPWVTQDRVPARVGIDEYRYASFEEDDWKPATGDWDDSAVHGWVNHEGDTLLLRCRLSQLPEVREPQPAEDPDEWVVQDLVPARPGVDERRYIWSDGDVGSWADCASMNWRVLPVHGMKTPSASATVELRCRRRDLPPVEQSSLGQRIKQTMTTEWIQQAAENENGCPVGAGASRVEQPEQWPKYYRVEDQDIAYLIRLSATKLRYVYQGGSTGVTWTWSEEDEAAVREELTKAEAMALLKKPECEPNTSDPACPDCGAVDCERAKSSSRECSSSFEPGQRKVCERCGRMNCESLTQPQKTRVRLWMTQDGIVCIGHNALPDGDWKEINYDADTRQFYVEQGK